MSATLVLFTAKQTAERSLIVIDSLLSLALIPSKKKKEKKKKVNSLNEMLNFGICWDFLQSGHKSVCDSNWPLFSTKSLSGWLHKLIRLFWSIIMSEARLTLVLDSRKRFAYYLNILKVSEIQSRIMFRALFWTCCPSSNDHLGLSVF